MFEFGFNNFLIKFLMIFKLKQRFPNHGPMRNLRVFCQDKPPFIRTLCFYRIKNIGKQYIVEYITFSSRSLLFKPFSQLTLSLSVSSQWKNHIVFMAETTRLQFQKPLLICIQRVKKDFQNPFGTNVKLRMGVIELQENDLFMTNDKFKRGLMGFTSLLQENFPIVKTLA